MTDTFTKTVTIKAVDEESRTATGAVLVPDELDHQADFFRPDAVERFHSEDVETGVMHSAFPDDAAEFERLEVIDEAETIDGEEFPAGTLVGTRQYKDDDLWQLVADGVLTGFSIGGDVSEAADHNSVPDDVRIPDAVDMTADERVTELVDGTVNEVSDVDIPAVPRATYKGAELGKALLDDVDGEAEFVAVMTEERGHNEDDARRLYQYLTDVRDKTRRRDALDKVGKPFESPEGAEFEDFEDCVQTLMDGDELSRPEAEQVCGAWQSETKNLDDPEFSEGDAVEWSSDDTTVRGRVADIDDEFSPAEGVTITGDEDEAVYLIHELDDSLEPPQYRRENVAKPESSLDESAADLPAATEGNFEETMTQNTDDGIDDATKLQVIKSWLTGGTSDDDVSPESGQSEAVGKATDDDEDDDDEDDEMEATANTNTMTDNTDKSNEPPAWADELTEKVEQIDKRVSEMEGDDAEKALADAPDWAQNIAEKVDDLDQRVETISKQSGHSQQLGKTEDETSEKSASGFTLDPRKTGGD